MRTLIICLAVALWMVGCASHPVRLIEANEVPVQRVFELPDVKGLTPAIVYMVRDSLGGTGVRAVELYLDGRHVADIKAGEKLWFECPPGTRLFALKSLGSLNEFTEEIVAGESYNYRISGAGAAAGFKLQRSAFLD